MPPEGVCGAGELSKVLEVRHGAGGGRAADVAAGTAAANAITAAGSRSHVSALGQRAGVVALLGLGVLLPRGVLGEVGDAGAEAAIVRVVST